MKHIFTLFAVILLILFTQFVNAANISSTPSGGLWSSASTWVGNVVPTTSDNVTIVSGATVTISNSINCTDLIVLGTLSSTSSTIIINGNIDVTGTFSSGISTINATGNGKAFSGNCEFSNLAISGSYTNLGTLTVTSNLSGSGSLTQNANSFLYIQGSVTITTLNAAANPNTVTYNGTGAVSIVASTYYNLIINTTNIATSSGFVGVNGAFNIQSGGINDNGYQISGSTGGSFTMASGTILSLGYLSSVTAFPNNFTAPNISLGAGSTVRYNSDFSQNISNIIAYQNLELNSATAVSKSPSGNLTVNESIIIGANNTLNMNSNSLSISGNFINNGSFNSTGNIVFTGSKHQQINGASSISFNNIEINKSDSVVELFMPVNINGQLILTNGKIQSSNTNKLIINYTGSLNGGSNSSYVEGPVQKAGNSAFTFPVGENGVYQPISISAPASISDVYVAEYVNHNAGADGFYLTSIGAGINHVSKAEYWTLTQLNGTTGVNVTLFWNTNSGVNNVTDLRVAGWNGSFWTVYGGNSSGNTTSGNISSTVIPSSYGVFTLASATNQNPLGGLMYSISSTNVSCNSGNNGAATINVTGGVSPYTYQWSNLATTQTAINLTAGTYIVTIQDAVLDTLIASVTIFQPPLLTFTESHTNVQCNGNNNGLITITSNGGTSPFQYSINNGVIFQGGNIFNLLPAGIYQLVVKDANNCISVATSVTLTQPPILVVNAGIASTVCTGDIITLGGSPTASGGSSGYTYSWVGPNGFTSSLANPVISNSNPSNGGTYTVTVTDALGCTAVSNPVFITVNVISTIPSSISASTNPICIGSSTNLNVIGGSLGTGANWSWYSGACGGTFEGNGTTITVTPVSNKIYYVRAEGICNSTSCGPSIVVTIDILPTTNAGTDAVVCDTNGYSLSASFGGSASWGMWTSNGTGVFDDSFSPTAVYTPSISDVLSGSVALSFTTDDPPDACPSPASDTMILTINQPVIVNAGADQIFCTNNSSLSLSGNVTNATGGVWNSSGTGSFDNPSSMTATYFPSGADIISGNVTLTLNSTGNGICLPGTDIVVVIISPVPFASAGSDQTICSGQNANLTASGGDTYIWGNGMSTAGISVSPLVSTLYSVTVADANGCTASDTVSVFVNATTSSILTETACDSYLLNGTTYNLSGTYLQTLVNMLGCDSVITLNLIITNSTSGSENITACDSYFWQANSTTYSASGTYTAMLTNAAGCDSTITLNLTINIATSSILTHTACDSYTLNGNTYTISGTYIQTIVNAVGCDSVITLNLTINPLPIVSFTGIGTSTCAVSQYVMLIGNQSPNGMFSGSGLINNGFNPAIAGTGLHNISYTFTDINGCTATDVQQVTVYSIPTMQLISSAPTTCGNANGSATVDGLNGIAPYLFNWSNGSLNSTITNLSSGVYIVTITDANGCSGVSSVNILATDGPVITVNSTTNSSCNYSFDGTADITVTNGAEPYTYLWTSGETTEDAANLAEGLNTVTVTDLNNCNSYLTVNTISTLEAPVIYGRISYSSGYLDGQYASLKIFSLIVNNNGGYDTLSRDASIGSDGTYVLYNFEPGQYIIKVILQSNPYTGLINSYYTTLVANTHIWEEATSVTLGCGQNIEANIMMAEQLNNGTGNGYLNGTIVQNNTGAKSRGVHINLGKLAGEPVPGAEVYVELDPDGEPIANTVTDTSGFFAFEEIPVGGYSLRVEIPGFPMISTYQVLITPTDTVFPDLDFIVDYSADSGFVDTSMVYINNLNNEVIALSTYPNPFIETVNVSYTLSKAHEICIEMYDVTGKVIESTGRILRDAGSYIFTPKQSEFMPGAYFIQFRVDNTVYLKKIIKTQ